MYGLKLLQKLDQKKYRDELGCFLVEGKKGVLDAVEAGAEVIQLVATDSFVRSQVEFCQQPQIKPFFKDRKVIEVGESGFAQMADTATPQGIAAVVKKPTTELSDLLKGKTLALFDDIRDPGNMGTMIRTADWFGVDGIIFYGGADPYQP